MNNAANAVMRPYGNVPMMPAMPPRAPPGLALPSLPLVNMSEINHAMLLHDPISPALGVGYYVSNHNAPSLRGHQRQRGNPKSSVSQRLAIAASDRSSSRSRCSSMSSMCSMSSVSSGRSMDSTVASSILDETIEIRCYGAPMAVIMKNVPDEYT